MTKKGSDSELLAAANEAEEKSKTRFVRRLRTIENFRYDEVQEKYWDTTTGILLGGKSVDGSVCREDWPTTVDSKGKVKPIRPSIAINDVLTGLTVEGSTWWPGKGKYLENTVVTDRGAMNQAGAVSYNTYVAPDRSSATPGDPAKWVDHIKKLFPDPIEQNHFFDYAAHMVQFPHIKANHGIVIAGEQGIGKDTALSPLREGVGQWNAAEIEPDAILSPYNGYIKSVLLVINEVRPHDEDHKASNFYNQIKPILAAPPNMLPMEVKHINVIYIQNVCRVILTTNDPLRMYIPREDRRLFVMSSPLPDPKSNDVFPPNYFEDLWRWLVTEGNNIVIDWLLKRDISEFDAAGAPPMTSGKQLVIDSANQVRRTLIDNLIEDFITEVYDGKPPEVIFHKDLLDFLSVGNFFDESGSARKQLLAKNFHFKMNDHGYNMIKNPDSSEWKNVKFRTNTAFVSKEIPTVDQVLVVQNELQKRPLELKLKEIH